MEKRFYRFCVAVLALPALGLGALASAASEPRAELWFTQRNGKPIEPTQNLENLQLGDRLVGELRLTAGTGGVGSYSISLRFDSDGGDIVDIVSVTRGSPSSFDAFPAAPPAGRVESSVQGAGAVRSFSAISFPFGKGGLEAEATTVIGSLALEAKRLGSTRVDSGLFNVGTDGVTLQDSGSPAAPLFGRATLKVPEPGAALLQFSALVSLAFLNVTRRGSGLERVRHDRRKVGD